MPRNSKGICRICGYYGDLSFEHIPPRRVFNNEPRVFETMQDFLTGFSPTKFPRGIGKRSLCKTCNSRTGDWYGDAFAEWTRQGLEYFEKLGDKGLFYLPYYIKPLNVIKQVLVMALAMSSEKTLNYHRELRMFVLNKEQKYLPPKYRVHVYFNTNGQPRFVSDMAIMRIDTGSSSYVEAEVSLPPFGYCISTSRKGTKSLAENQGLGEITWFSRFSYNEWTCVQLRLPAKETHEPLPLDYRSESEIDSHYRTQGIQRKKNKAIDH